MLSGPNLALVLSREAGAAAELGGDAFMVDPYDVSRPRALWDALALSPASRAERCERLAAASRSALRRRSGSASRSQRFS